MNIKPAGKAVMIAVVVGVGGLAANHFMKKGYFNEGTTVASVVPSGMDINVTGGASPATTSVNIAPASGQYVAKVLTIPWNATLGLQYANGGPITTPDSLMAKHGVKLAVERQDNYDQMIAEQVKFAKELSDGNANPASGAAFVIIMGDGYPAYVAGAQEAMKKLGQSIEVVGALGYSRGEDKCMLPANVKSNPQLARGSLIGAVLRDGDWNICVKWAADNGIPVNPDEKTYDPDAMNFVSVDAFTKADDNLIAGYAEEREVVMNGKKTGEKRRVVQNGTATWTPGDVKVAQQKGGMVAVASTREYMWQMPSILIGNKQWMEKNPQFVENVLAAAFQGGELVRSNDDALTKASNVAAAVFKEETGPYWKKYFKGVIETDRTGLSVPLGGSTTNGLSDNAFLFGLNGNDNVYKRVYSVFGNITSKLYPTILPTVVPYESAVNTKYLQSLLGKASNVTAAVTPTFNSTSQVTGVMAKKAYSIEFKSGSTAFTPAATTTLEELLNQLSVSGMTIQINGHTDNVGNSASNLELSKKRADAVKAWLTANASSTFPADRVRTRGYGDSSPVADNSTADGKAKNRRVEVLMVETQ